MENMTSPVLPIINEKKCLGEESLHAFLQGEMDPAEALFVATHCHLSCEARKRLMELTNCAAAAMEQAEPQKMRCTAQSFFEQKCTKKAKGPKKSIAAIFRDKYAKFRCCSAKCEVPKPLQSLIGTSYRKLKWVPKDIPGIEYSMIDVPGSKGIVKLVRLAKGALIPEHVHEDDQMILILYGHTRCGDTELKRGDVGVFIADPDKIYAPECLDNTLLMWVSMGKTRFSGLLAKIMAPFIR